MSCFFILDISILSNVRLLKSSSQSVCCHFVLFTVSFALQKLCNFMRSHLPIGDLRGWTVGDLFKKFPCVLMCWKLFPNFSSIKFSVSGFMWRSLIHLDLTFVQGDKCSSIFSLLHPNCYLIQHHFLTIMSSFH